MSGSTFGKIFKVTTWGESHGKALGVVIDGCPSGIKLNEADFKKDLEKRATAKSDFASPRKEADEVEILSGVFEGSTLGTPISIIVKNKDARSSDYTKLKDVYRPGHADFSYEQKYGIRDYLGGGRASGRETISRVLAATIAKKILAEIGIDFLTYTKSIKDIEIQKNEFQKIDIEQNHLEMPNNKKAGLAEKLIKEIRKEGDSLGGKVECIINGVPAGIGEPVFDKLDARLAKAIMSIGAIKAVEIGNGVEASLIKGSQNNDEYYYESSILKKHSNNAGGIYGGISDGSTIIVRATVKPTPSISKQGKSINKAGENISLSIGGRNDTLIIPRINIVIESMVAVTLCDLLLENASSKIENIKRIYS